MLQMYPHVPTLYHVFCSTICGAKKSCSTERAFDRNTVQECSCAGEECQKIWGCTRLALNFTPIPQDSKLLGRCTEVKPKFAFFQKQRERFAVNAVVFAQYTLRLVPKIFNAVDMVLALGKRFAMVDAVMDKTAHIQFVITAQAVCI